jgi:hypothetical protein
VRRGNGFLGAVSSTATPGCAVSQIFRHRQTLNNRQARIAKLGLPRGPIPCGGLPLRHTCPSMTWHLVSEQTQIPTPIPPYFGWLTGWTPITSNWGRPEKRSTFASNFDLAASFAFRAMAAAATVVAGDLLAGSSGVSSAAVPAAAVTRRAIAVAWGITIDADMGGHGAPPTNPRDCDRLLRPCQT